MSALCHNRTYAAQLFDHIVGDPQQTTRNFALWGALTSATLAMFFRMRSDPLPCCGF
jgi:hypothetical protein